MTFADRLRAEMQREKLSQQDLATDLRVSQPTISAWLNGEEPKRAQYVRLLRRFPRLIADDVFNNEVSA